MALSLDIILFSINFNIIPIKPIILIPNFLAIFRPFRSSIIKGSSSFFANAIDWDSPLSSRLINISYISWSSIDCSCNLSVDNVESIGIIILGNDEGSSTYEIADISFYKRDGSWDYLDEDMSFYITTNQKTDILITLHGDFGHRDEIILNKVDW